MYYLGLLLVGVIWGITNCYMEKGVKNEENTKSSSITKFLSLIAKPKVFMPYLIN